MGLAAVAALGLALPAAAAEGQHPRSVSSHFDDKGWLLFTPQSCSPSQTGLCTVSGQGMVDYSGDLTGFSEYHATGWFDPAIQGARFKVWETFTGSIAGCGTGSVRWYAEGQLPGSGFDPTTMTAPFSQTWRFLPGTATGELVGITGSGTASGPMNLLTRENHGTMQGSITCHPSRERTAKDAAEGRRSH